MNKSLIAKVGHAIMHLVMEFQFFGVFMLEIADWRRLSQYEVGLRWLGDRRILGSRYTM